MPFSEVEYNAINHGIVYVFEKTSQAMDCVELFCTIWIAFNKSEWLCAKRENLDTSAYSIGHLLHKEHTTCIAGFLSISCITDTDGAQNSFSSLGAAPSAPLQLTPTDGDAAFITHFNPSQL